LILSKNHASLEQYEDIYEDVILISRFYCYKLHLFYNFDKMTPDVRP